mmetsp:Transcript_26288/g.61112  ORF Transcript_26288/g.61112 Transcript_26288/m.61112 type:complete len:255 (+) Transcript_26288:245-1009(+)
MIAILGKSDLLVGHSLENDLHALRLAHHVVVDTSVLFRGSNGRKYSLRHLAGSLLQKEIQTESSQGHCSEEDAATSLRLAVRRAQEGPSFRIVEADDNRYNILSSLDKDVGPVVCVGPSKWLKKHVPLSSTAAHALACESIDNDSRKAVPAWLCDPNRRAALVWANFVVKSKPSDYETANQFLDDTLEKMHPGVLMLIALQKGLRHAREETSTRKVRKNRRSSLGWSSEDEENWQKNVENCRSGFAVWIGVHPP